MRFPPDLAARHNQRIRQIVHGDVLVDLAAQVSKQRAEDKLAEAFRDVDQLRKLLSLIGKGTHVLRHRYDR